MTNHALASDSELVSRFKGGCQSSIKILVDRHKQRIFSSIYFLVKDRELAEDLFQDVFIKIITCINDNRYNDQGKFLPWALRISHNLVIDYFRKNKLMPLQHDTETYSVFDYLANEQRNAEQQLIHTERINKVKQLIQMLPAEQREVVMLRHYGELSFKEIADHLNININTALGRMHYAVLKMRELMHAEENLEKVKVGKIK
ncbi:MAG: hypothetical protein RIQ89_584 [Bacteroidota bacterium]|jgi:RNA polymerase sigma-70 factor (ECF subfamily)